MSLLTFSEKKLFFVLFNQKLKTNRGIIEEFNQKSYPTFRCSCDYIWEMTTVFFLDSLIASSGREGAKAEFNYVTFHGDICLSPKAFFDPSDFKKYLFKFSWENDFFGPWKNGSWKNWKNEKPTKLPPFRLKNTFFP